MTPIRAAADPLDASVFAGFGLGLGQTNLMPAAGGARSKFDDSSYLIEAGATTGGDVGGMLSAEFGQSSVRNQLVTQSYFEIGNLDYYALKAGMNYGAFSLGGGYRHNELTVKSLALSPATYLESKYSGWTPMAFANVSFNVRKRYIGAIEVQYESGQLKSTDSALQPVKMNGLSISLRYFIVFD